MLCLMVEYYVSSLCQIVEVHYLTTNNQTTFGLHSSRNITNCEIFKRQQLNFEATSFNTDNTAESSIFQGLKYFQYVQMLSL